MTVFDQILIAVGLPAWVVVLAVHVWCDRRGAVVGQLLMQALACSALPAVLVAACLRGTGWASWGTHGLVIDCTLLFAFCTALLGLWFSHHVANRRARSFTVARSQRPAP